MVGWEMWQESMSKDGAFIGKWDRTRIMCYKHMMAMGIFSIPTQIQWLQNWQSLYRNMMSN